MIRFPSMPFPTSARISRSCSPSGPDGRQELWVFDGCECCFHRATCAPAADCLPQGFADPRELGDGGIAAGGGLLYAADPGAGHVLVFGCAAGDVGIAGIFEVRDGGTSS